MNDISEYRRLKFFEALRLVLVLAVCLAAMALLAFSSGCAAVPAGAAEIPAAVSNEIVRIGCILTNAAAAAETFPATEEEYLARCEAGIQEKLLDYPEEERERMHDLLVSEASTAYFFQSLLVGLATSVVDRATEPAAPATSSTGEHEENGEGAQASSDSPSSPSSPVLLFRYGGFDGSRAVEDQATWIEAFRFTSTGMSYQWASSSLRPWGLEDTEAGALACAFYWSDKEQKWIGGKFDWISTSRTSRSWENIRGRYNGWDPDAFFSAKRHAFCIVSRDGKRRTNLLTD